MKKQSALLRLEQVKISAEDKELDDMNRILILDILLDYINDPDIRQAVEDIPL